MRSGSLLIEAKAGWLRSFLFSITVLAAWLTPLTVHGQTLPVDQIDDWDRESYAALALLDKPDGSDLSARIDLLEAARARIAAQRDIALVASRNRSLDAIIIDGKLDFLGAIPEGGETAFATDRRNELAEALYQAEAPNRQLQESYLRSLAVVSQLDAKIEALTFKRLTSRATSPLLPKGWAAFFNESNAKLAGAFAKPEGRVSVVPVESRALALVLSILSLVTGLAVAILVRRLVLNRLTIKLEAGQTAGRMISLVILRDFAGLAIPLAGLAIVTAGTFLLASMFPPLQRAPELVLIAGLPLVLALWLGITLFAPRVASLRFVNLGRTDARSAVRMLLLLGLALALETLLEGIENGARYSPTASGVMPFLIVSLTSFSLYRLAKVLDRHRTTIAAASADEIPSEEDDEFIHRKVDWTRISAIAMKVAAVLSFAFSVVGYVALARAVLLPTIETLAIVSLFVVTYFRIQMLAEHIWARWFGKKEGLASHWQFVLFLVLALAAAPIIALIWGLRPAQLADFVELLRNGFTVGEATVSLETILVFLGAFILGYIVTRWLQRLLHTSSFGSDALNDGTRSALVTGVGYLGIIISFIIAIAVAGIDLSNLAIVAGALSVGIGFGMQSVVANFISGIIMLIERPIKEGDSIEVGGYAGIVDKISVRATRIKSFNHDDVIIPNSELITGTVRNRTLTDRMTRIECAVGIAYDADIRRAFDIILDVARSQEGVSQEPEPNVVMENLGDSALLLRLYCFVDDVSMGMSAKSQMYVEIVERFRAEGIEIPFQQMDVRILASAGADKTAGEGALGSA